MHECRFVSSQTLNTNRYNAGFMNEGNWDMVNIMLILSLIQNSTSFLGFPLSIIQLCTIRLHSSRNYRWGSAKNTEGYLIWICAVLPVCLIITLKVTGPLLQQSNSLNRRNGQLQNA